MRCIKRQQKKQKQLDGRIVDRWSEGRWGEKVMPFPLPVFDFGSVVAEVTPIELVSASSVVSPPTLLLLLFSLSSSLSHCVEWC